MNAPTITDPQEIIRAIQLGVTDDELAQVEFAIKQRRSLQRYKLSPGTKVKLNHTVRPKYLVGATATIVRVNKTRVVVNFDTNGQYLGRYANAPVGVTVPFDLLEVV